MKYVAVKHKPEHTNVWWFAVPTELEERVYVGANVLCMTKKGKATGKIEHIMDSVPQNLAEKIIGKHFPLKTIIAVNIEMPIEEIHIPLDYIATNPEAVKITKRIEEFYTTGKFNTPVIFSADGNLRDGYTAYLVAKMFEHETLRGFCVIE